MRDSKYVAISCSLVFTASFLISVGIQFSWSAYVVHRALANLSSGDESVRRKSIACLNERKVDVFPALLKLLEHENSGIRHFAIWELQNHLPLRPEYIEACKFAALDKNESENVRWAALLTLRKVGAQSRVPITKLEKSIVVALASLLKDDGWTIDTAYALSSFGPRAELAVDALMIALDSEDELARIQVAGALCAIVPEKSDELLPILVSGVESEEALVQDWALHFIGLMGSKAQSAIPALTALAESDSRLELMIEDAMRQIRK